MVVADHSSNECLSNLKNKKKRKEKKTKHSFFYQVCQYRSIKHEYKLDLKLDSMPLCDKCNKQLSSFSALQRHLARKRPCDDVKIAPQLVFEPKRVVWKPLAGIRLSDPELIQNLYTLAPLSAYCARSPLDRVNEKTSLTPVTFITMGILRLSHKDPAFHNIKLEDGKLHVFENCKSPELPGPNWFAKDPQEFVEELIQMIASELWYHLNKSPATFSLANRCAISTTVLSIQNGTSEWLSLLGPNIQTKLMTYLKEAHLQVTEVLGGTELGPRVAKAPAAKEVTRLRRIDPLCALSADMVARYFNTYRHLPVLDLVENMLGAAAADLNVKNDRQLQDRIEQKLWEAADEIIPKELNFLVETVRDYLKI